MKTIIALILCLVVSAASAENRNISNVDDSEPAVFHGYSSDNWYKLDDGFDLRNFDVTTAREEADMIIMEDSLPYAITFVFYGKEYGKLEFENDSLTFKGNADKSAQVFFDGFLKPIVERYIKLKCGKDAK